MNLLEQTDDDLQQFDDNKNYLEDLVGEGKKFKDHEELAKAKARSDAYIDTLTRRMDELRQDYAEVSAKYNAGTKLEDLIGKIGKTQDTSEDTLPPVKEDNTQPAIKQEQIESLVSNRIKQHEIDKKHEENFRAVQAKLKERYGNNFASVLKERVESLGLTDDLVNNLARTAPNAFFNTLGFNEQQFDNNFQAPPRSQQRTDNFAPKSNKRTLSYYEKLRKDKPMLYYDPKIAVQMDKDSQELGKEFFDV